MTRLVTSARHPKGRRAFFLLQPFGSLLLYRNV